MSTLKQLVQQTIRDNLFSGPLGELRARLGATDQELLDRELTAVVESSTSMLETTKLLSRSLAVDATAGDFMRLCKRLFAASAVKLMLAEPTGERFRCFIDSDDEQDEIEPAPAGVGITGSAFAGQRAFLLDDVSLAPAFDACVDGIDRHPTNSQLTVPLISDKGAIGVVSLLSNEPGTFSSDDDSGIWAPAPHRHLATPHSTAPQLQPNSLKPKAT